MPKRKSTLKMVTPAVAKGPPSPKGRVWVFEIPTLQIPPEWNGSLQGLFVQYPAVRRVHWSVLPRLDGEIDPPVLYHAGILIFKDSQRVSMCLRILPEAQWTPYKADKEVAKEYLQDIYGDKWEPLFNHYQGGTRRSRAPKTKCTCPVPHVCVVRTKDDDVPQNGKYSK